MGPITYFDFFLIIPDKWAYFGFFLAEQFWVLIFFHVFCIKKEKNNSLGVLLPQYFLFFNEKIAINLLKLTITAKSHIFSSLSLFQNVCTNIQLIYTSFKA